MTSEGLLYYYRKIRNKLIVLPKFFFNRYLKGKRVNLPPIFIVGCGNSGTSLMLTILGSHKNIYAIPTESHALLTKHPKRYFKEFNRMTIANKKDRWLEKSPKHVYKIDEILNHFPEAKIIYMLRDGRDVAVSLKKRNGDLKKSINRWIRDNTVGEKYLESPNVMRVKYEDLVVSPADIIKNVFEFLDEPYDEDVLSYHKKPKYYYSMKIEKPQDEEGFNHNRNRNWQINQPIFDGRGKWKSLSKDEKDMIKSMANDMLVKYDYVKDKTW